MDYLGEKVTSTNQPSDRIGLGTRHATSIRRRESQCTSFRTPAKSMREQGMIEFLEGLELCPSESGPDSIRNAPVRGFSLQVSPEHMEANESNEEQRGAERRSKSDVSATQSALKEGSKYTTPDNSPRMSLCPPPPETVASLTLSLPHTTPSIQHLCFFGSLLGRTNAGISPDNHDPCGHVLALIHPLRIPAYHIVSLEASCSQRHPTRQNS